MLEKLSEEKRDVQRIEHGQNPDQQSVYRCVYLYTYICIYMYIHIIFPQVEDIIHILLYFIFSLNSLSGKTFHLIIHVSLHQSNLFCGGIILYFTNLQLCPPRWFQVLCFRHHAKMSLFIC